MTKSYHLLQSLFRINPIIVKEIRSRMRGPRVFITLTLILLAMGAVMFAMLQILLASARYTNVLSPQVGQSLFAALAFLELFMICAITPAVTAGAVSSEKERQTYEMLMSTPLSPTSILWGKLVSALSYVLLLLFAGVPLASVVFIFGGVAPRDMLKALMVLGAISVAYGILGMFMSVLFGRTGRATVASFITVVVLMIGPLFLAALIGVVRGGEPPRWILAPSPISALSSALAPSMNTDMGGVFYVLSGLFNMGVAPISQTNIPRPMYHYTLPFYTILSVLLYMLSTRLIQPTRQWRLRWKELLAGVVTFLVVIGLLVGGFLLTANRYEWSLPVRNGTNPDGRPAIMPLPAQQVFPDKQVVPVMPEENTPTPAADQTGTPVGASSNQEPMNDEAQAEIYAAVTRQLFTVDNTFGQSAPSWKGLYLISLTDDRIGDPKEPAGDPVAFSDAVLSGVAQRLNDLSPKIMWIKGKVDAAPDPKTGEVDGGESAVITFGNIHPQKDGTVHVSASLYFGSLGATGKTYILSYSDGTWTISGTTGAEWIS